MKREGSHRIRKNAALFLLAFTATAGSLPACAGTGDADAYTQFSLDLLAGAADQNSEGGNVLISPLSAGYVLGMLGAGAQGDTLQEIEDAEGTDSEAFSGYLKELTVSGEDVLSCSSSFWYADSFKDRIQQPYLQDIAGLFGADAEDFQKGQGQSQINSWISSRTDGMFTQFLGPSDQADMYLVNTLLMDAEWEKPYLDYQVKADRDFTNRDKTVSKVTMLQGGADSLFSIGGADGFLSGLTRGQERPNSLQFC